MICHERRLYLFGKAPPKSWHESNQSGFVGRVHGDEDVRSKNVHFNFVTFSKRSKHSDFTTLRVVAIRTLLRSGSSTHVHISKKFLYPIYMCIYMYTVVTVCDRQNRIGLTRHCNPTASHPNSRLLPRKFEHIQGGIVLRNREEIESDSSALGILICHHVLSPCRDTVMPSSTRPSSKYC